MLEFKCHTHIYTYTHFCSELYFGVVYMLVSYTILRISSIRTNAHLCYVSIYYPLPDRYTRSRMSISFSNSTLHTDELEFINLQRFLFSKLGHPGKKPGFNAVICDIPMVVTLLSLQQICRAHLHNNLAEAHQ